jgi:hypothetical protein
MNTETIEIVIDGSLDQTDIEEAKNYIGSKADEVKSLMFEIWDDVDTHGTKTHERMNKVALLLGEAHYRLMLIDESL